MLFSGEDGGVGRVETPVTSSSLTGSSLQASPLPPISEFHVKSRRSFEVEARRQEDVLFRFRQALSRVTGRGSAIGFDQIGIALGFQQPPGSDVVFRSLRLRHLSKQPLGGY